jgi:hypothetical protein
MTTEERLDRIETALAELAEDVAPATMSHRATRHQAIASIITERRELAEQAAS